MARKKVLDWKEAIKAKIDDAYSSSSGIEDEELIEGLGEIAEHAGELARLRKSETRED
jgi:hypothetical protein